ncbi:MAG: transposase [Patescibacteria group bacterium]|nr:transposase [Patescibacteria group bacterium]
MNRSIAKYEIFNFPNDFLRFINILDLYRFIDFRYSYSIFSRLSLLQQQIIISGLRKNPNIDVQIIAYCVMPTHFHLILKQLVDGGISTYISRVLNSYSKSFNLIHKRKGPLWEGRFKNILITTDEQLLHLSRYLHLNPTSAGLVKKPEEWQFSSYQEFIGKQKQGICDFRDVIDINPGNYKKFVLERASYQKKLSKIKKILLENHTD